MKTRKLIRPMFLLIFSALTLPGCYTQLACSLEDSIPSQSSPSSHYYPSRPVVVYVEPIVVAEPASMILSMPSPVTSSSVSAVSSEEQRRSSGYERGSYSESNAGQSEASPNSTRTSGEQRRGGR
jgi:hypothetical protein